MRKGSLPTFVLVVLLATLGVPRTADAEPRAQLTLERQKPYAGVPFTLAMVVEGFDEKPAPALPKLEIAGAKVTPVGVEPSVRESIQIFNGQRSQSREVTWIFRWSVELSRPGRVRVGPVTAVQGSRRAVAAAGDLEVEAVQTTSDMKFELAMPTRPVYVGETFELKLLWSFVREPDDPQFSLPIASHPDFTIAAAPATDPRKTIALQIGGKQLGVPYEVEQAEVGGRRMNRVTLRLYATPKRAGTIELPPASVLGQFLVGRADFFGRGPTQMFRASDVARTLDVKALPETNKPASFAGAVGTQFSMAVEASRSVVQLGEPVELSITVKGDQRLDTLALPRLDGPGGLPKDKFTVPGDAPTGELSEDGKTKTFKVTAQVTGPATEIPAIAFSYFDPAKGQYQTIHSDPIAVSVKGGSIVGAGDVVAVAPRPRPGVTAPQASDAEIALVGAELALSAPGDVDRRPISGALLWLLVAALYAIPLALLGGMTWKLRTRTQREEAAEVRLARRRVEEALARAAKDPARETAGPLVAALRAFARSLDRDTSNDGGLLATIETESFAPSSAARPLAEDLRGRADDLVRRWTAEARRTRSAAQRSGKGGAAAALIVLGLLAPRESGAAGAGERSLADGRKAYQEAMGTSDASARKAAFARAAAALGDAVRAQPDRPELLTDWGNAALGAGDVATATLAYRRALALDGSTPRARRNLSWLRSRQPDALRPSGESAADALFFFHQWPGPRRLLVGAAAFALAVLLIVPWGGRRRRALTGVAALAGVIWIAMLASVLVEDRRENDAIVMDGVVLRAADSAGAPAAHGQALPRGTEVTLLERRDGWAKVRIANGTAGWLPDGAVQPVAP